MTTTPPLADVPIRSADDLTARWHLLLNPPVFGARSLWLSWFGSDGRMLPVVVPVDDMPLVPEPAMLMGLVQVHDTITEEHLDGEGHLAMALCRPGDPRITEDDDEWAEALRSVLDDGQIDGTWSLHLAAGGAVVPLVQPPSSICSASATDAERRSSPRTRAAAPSAPCRRRCVAAARRLRVRTAGT